MDRPDSALELRVRARGARARTILFDLVAGLLLAGDVLLWLAHRHVRLDGWVEWSRGFDHAWPVGFPIVASTALAAAHLSRSDSGSETDPSVDGERRANAEMFGELSCVAAVALHGAAFLVAVLALRSGVGVAEPLAFATAAIVVAVLVSGLSSAVRRPTYPELDPATVAALRAASRKWPVPVVGRWRWSRVVVVWLVPGACAMVAASVCALGFGVAAHVGTVCLLTLAGVVLGVIVVAAHFGALRVAALSLAQSRPVLASLALLVLAWFDLRSGWAVLDSGLDAWSAGLGLMMVGIVGAFGFDIASALNRERAAERGWIGVGLASSVRSALERQAEGAGDRGRPRWGLQRWYLEMAGRRPAPPR